MDQGSNNNESGAPLQPVVAEPIEIAAPTTEVRVLPPDILAVMAELQQVKDDLAASKAEIVAMGLHLEESEGRLAGHVGSAAENLRGMLARKERAAANDGRDYRRREAIQGGALPLQTPINNVEVSSADLLAAGNTADPDDHRIINEGDPEEPLPSMSAGDTQDRRSLRWEQGSMTDMHHIGEPQVSGPRDFAPISRAGNFDDKMEFIERYLAASQASAAAKFSNTKGTASATGSTVPQFAEGQNEPPPPVQRHAQPPHKPPGRSDVEDERRRLWDEQRRQEAEAAYAQFLEQERRLRRLVETRVTPRAASISVTKSDFEQGKLYQEARFEEQRKSTMHKNFTLSGHDYTPEQQQRDSYLMVADAEAAAEQHKLRVENGGTGTTNLMQSSGAMKYPIIKEQQFNFQTLTDMVEAATLYEAQPGAKPVYPFTYLDPSLGVKLLARNKRAHANQTRVAELGLLPMMANMTYAVAQFMRKDAFLEFIKGAYSPEGPREYETTALQLGRAIDRKHGLFPAANGKLEQTDIARFIPAFDEKVEMFIKFVDLFPQHSKCTDAHGKRVLCTYFPGIKPSRGIGTMGLINVLTSGAGFVNTPPAQKDETDPPSLREAIESVLVQGAAQQTKAQEASATFALGRVSHTLSHWDANRQTIHPFESTFHAYGSKDRLRLESQFDDKPAGEKRSRAATPAENRVTISPRSASGEPRAYAPTSDYGTRRRFANDAPTSYPPAKRPLLRLQNVYEQPQQLEDSDDDGRYQPHGGAQRRMYEDEQELLRMEDMIREQEPSYVRNDNEGSYRPQQHYDSSVEIEELFDDLSISSGRQQQHLSNIDIRNNRGGDVRNHSDGRHQQDNRSGGRQFDNRGPPQQHPRADSRYDNVRGPQQLVDTNSRRPPLTPERRAMLKSTGCFEHARGQCNKGDSCIYGHGDAEIDRLTEEVKQHQESRRASRPRAGERLAITTPMLKPKPLSSLKQSSDSAGKGVSWDASAHQDELTKLNADYDRRLTALNQRASQHQRGTLVHVGADRLLTGRPNGEFDEYEGDASNYSSGSDS